MFIKVHFQQFEFFINSDKINFMVKLCDVRVSDDLPMVTLTEIDYSQNGRIIRVNETIEEIMAMIPDHSADFKRLMEIADEFLKNKTNHDPL